MKEGAPKSIKEWAFHAIDIFLQKIRKKNLLARFINLPMNIHDVRKDAFISKQKDEAPRRPVPKRCTSKTLGLTLISFVFSFCLHIAISTKRTCVFFVDVLFCVYFGCNFGRCNLQGGCCGCCGCCYKVVVVVTGLLLLQLVT